VPIYEFVCESCGNEFEQIQSFSESSVPACSKCGSAQVTRLLGRPAIHFKGSGWYINDSKKSKDKKSSNPTSATSGESSASDDATETKTKTESKVEANAEKKSEASGDAKSGTKSESSTASKSPTTSAASD